MRMQEQAPAQSGGGSGITEALVDTDKKLSTITQAVSQNDQIPDDIKGQFQSSLEAFRGALEGLLAFAKEGGGEAPAPEAEGPAPRGAVTPEQGASRGAVPVTPAGMPRR